MPQRYHESRDYRDGRELHVQVGYDMKLQASVKVETEPDAAEQQMIAKQKQYFERHATTGHRKVTARPVQVIYCNCYSRAASTIFSTRPIYEGSYSRKRSSHAVLIEITIIYV
jgi:hypothetical protein